MNKTTFGPTNYTGLTIDCARYTCLPITTQIKCVMYLEASLLKIYTQVVSLFCDPAYFFTRRRLLLNPSHCMGACDGKVEPEAAPASSLP